MLCIFHNVLFHCHCNQYYAAQDCSQLACFNCCDDENCEVHSDRRAILEGRNYINILASEQRKLAIIPGSFRETSFHYLGETAYLWSLTDFFANPKWRDDAIRRSRRNKEYYGNRKQKGTPKSTATQHKNQDLSSSSLDSNNHKSEATEKLNGKKRKKTIEHESSGKNSGTSCATHGGNRSRRFKRIMDQLFEESLLRTPTK